MSGDIDCEGLDIRYSGDKMPALFVAHGNSMSAIEETEYSQAWKSSVQSLPRPEGILCNVPPDLRALHRGVRPRSLKVLGYVTLIKGLDPGAAIRLILAARLRLMHSEASAAVGHCAAHNW